jgi:hypothetical protein
VLPRAALDPARALRAASRSAFAASAIARLVSKIPSCAIRALFAAILAARSASYALGAAAAASLAATALAKRGIVVKLTRRRIHAREQAGAGACLGVWDCDA